MWEVGEVQSAIRWVVWCFCPASDEQSLEIRILFHHQSKQGEMESSWSYWNRRRHHREQIAWHVSIYLVILFLLSTVLYLLWSQRRGPAVSRCGRSPSAMASSAGPGPSLPSPGRDPPAPPCVRPPPASLLPSPRLSWCVTVSPSPFIKHHRLPPLALSPSRTLLKNSEECLKGEGRRWCHSEDRLSAW